MLKRLFTKPQDLGDFFDEWACVVGGFFVAGLLLSGVAVLAITLWHLVGTLGCGLVAAFFLATGLYTWFAAPR
jgi:hypothetical protein